MSAKEILFDVNARNRILEGVDALAISEDMPNLGILKETRSKS